MKQFSANALAICLRVCVTAFVLIILSLFLFSFITATKLGDDVWQQLGLNRQQGTEGIHRSFTSGYLYYYQARNAKNIAGGNRLAVAKDLLTYAKQYMNSDEFKKDYAQERANAKPMEPELKPVRTRAQVQKEEIEKTKQSIKEFEENIKAFDTAMQRNMLPVLDVFKENLKNFQDPNNQYFESMVMGDKYQNEQSLRNYQEGLKNWERSYPADYSPIIRERLQKFLEITKDVDFAAELKTSYSKKVFVNPGYERKSTEWKQAFRAGKEITGMARTFAEQWLAELK